MPPKSAAEIRIDVGMLRFCSTCMDFKKEDTSFSGWCARYSQIRVAEQTCEKWKGAQHARQVERQEG